MSFCKPKLLRARRRKKQVTERKRAFNSCLCASQKSSGRGGRKKQATARRGWGVRNTDTTPPTDPMSFPPGLIPKLVREKLELEEPYYPLSSQDVEEAGLPPSQAPSAYLASRLDKFYAELQVLASCPLPSPHPSYLLCLFLHSLRSSSLSPSLPPSFLPRKLCHKPERAAEAK